VLDADQASMARALVEGVDLSPNGLATDTLMSHTPGEHFLGSEHTLANFETAFWTSTLADNSSFEQWEEGGGQDSLSRAHEAWRRLLGEYEAPPMEEAIREQLDDYVARRKAELPGEGA
jgi:trimethylamine--corrinoid protein Co-methyltransferase